MTKVVVTGGAGFGGSWITEMLVEEGFDVTAVDVMAPAEATNLAHVSDRIRYKWKSVHDLTPRDLEGAEIVIDFAAQADVPLGLSSPLWTCWQNIVGLYVLMEATRKTSTISKFIYPGSGTIFGAEQNLPIDEKCFPSPANPYSASKAAAEIVAQSYHRCYDVPVIIVRNGLVYGPRMRKEIVIAKFLIKALRNEPLIVEGGNQTRDPNYISNVGDAFLRVVDAPIEDVVGQIFHISYGRQITILELAKKCIKVVDSNSEIIFEPYRLGEEKMRQELDIGKAMEILQYFPEIGLEEGLRLTADWLRRELFQRNFLEKSSLIM